MNGIDAVLFFLLISAVLLFGPVLADAIAEQIRDFNK
jgi:hypothetical protein